MKGIIKGLIKPGMHIDLHPSQNELRIYSAYRKEWQKNSDPNMPQIVNDFESIKVHLKDIKDKIREESRVEHSLSVKIAQEDKIHYINKKQYINDKLKSIPGCQNKSFELSSKKITWKVVFKRKDKDAVQKQFEDLCQEAVNNKGEFKLQRLDFNDSEKDRDEMIPILLSKTLEDQDNEHIKNKVDLQEYNPKHGRPVKWYARCNDRTFEQLKDRHKVILNQYYKKWMKSVETNEYSPINDYDFQGNSIKLRNLKYDSVSFLEERKRQGFMVGFLKKKKDKHETKELAFNPHAAKFIYRVPQYCLQGKHEDVAEAFKVITDYFSMATQKEEKYN